MEVLRFGYHLPFLSTPPLSAALIPMSSYSPHSIKGAAVEEVTLGLIVKGAVELAPLPSPGFYSCLFVVWKTSGSWRPVIDLSHLNRFVDVSHFQMETIQSALLSVRQGDWMASIDLKEAYLQVPIHPGFSSLSTLRVQRPRLPVQSAVLWPLHGSAGLHSGHGSCIRYSPFYGDPYEMLSRRLARPVFLSGVPPQGSLDCPPALPRVGHCGEPSKVQPCSISGGSVSGGCHRRKDFQGFSVAGAHPQASVNSRRISVLRLASRELVALAAGRSFFAGSLGSWRQTVDAVPPDLPPSFLGSSRSRGSSVLVGGVSPRPAVVAPPSSSLSRGVSLPGVSRPTLLVRRLRRGVGCPSRSSDRFRLVGLAPGCVVHQRKKTARHQTGSPPVSVFSTRSHSGCLLRQHHSRGLSPQGGGHQIAFPQHLGSGDPALVGVSVHPSGSAVPTGLQQRPGGRFVSPSPAPSFRVVPQHDRLSIFMSTVAGPNRFICNLRKSSLFDILFTIPGSPVSGHGRVLQSWDGLQAYAFPLVTIIPRVLAKLRASRGTELTLVAPHWTQSPWFSDLLQLSLAPPVILPDRPDLLRLPRSRLLYPALHQLRLHAWRLSSDLPEPQASPSQ